MEAVVGEVAEKHIKLSNTSVIFSHWKWSYTWSFKAH